MDTSKHASTTLKIKMKREEKIKQNFKIVRSQIEIVEYVAANLFLLGYYFCF